MSRIKLRFIVTLVFVMAAPPSFAWEMLGRVVVIGPVSARALTRVDDPDHDATVIRTDAVLFEGGSQVANDNDLCIFKTQCKSKAIDIYVCPFTEYCGRGGAEERFVSNTALPIPFTRREWGGGQGAEPPVCKMSGAGGSGGGSNK